MGRAKRSAAQREMMLNGKLLKVIPLLAAPQIITMLVDTFYNIADAYFVSRIGDSAIAAVGINDSVMHLIRSMSLAFGVGCASYSSRLLGAGEDERASRVSSTILLTAMIVIGGVAAAASFDLSRLLSLMGAIDSIKSYSLEYGYWILLSSPLTAASVVLSQILRSEGNAKLSMFGQVSGCFVNLVLDPLFITHMGWGVAGAAIATGLSKAVSVAILSSHFVRGLTVLRVSPRLFSPSRDIYGEVIRMGLPAGVRSSGLAIANIVINNLAGGYGDMALAAVSVANKCMKLVSSVILGLGQGYQPIVGYCWGAKRYDRVERTFIYVSFMGVGVAVVLSAILALNAERMILLFTNRTEMMDLGMVLIYSQCVTMPAHVWSILANGLFQATGKALRAGILGLSRQVLVLIPCALIMNRLWGLWGLTRAQAAADIVSCTVAGLMTLPMMIEIKKMQKDI